MSIWASVGAVLLTLVGYATGIVLAARGREFLPTLWDLLLLLLSWTAVFVFHPFLGESRWLLVLTGLLLGIVVGFVFAQLRLAVSENPPAIPISELPEHAREKEKTAVLPWWRKAWQHWQVFGARLGAVQGRLLMGFFYFIFVTPFAVGMRLLSDPLHLKRASTQSYWGTKEPLDTTLDTAREQG